MITDTFINNYNITILHQKPSGSTNSIWEGQMGIHSNESLVQIFSNYK